MASLIPILAPKLIEKLTLSVNHNLPRSNAALLKTINKKIKNLKKRCCHFSVFLANRAVSLTKVSAGQLIGRETLETLFA